VRQIPPRLLAGIIALAVAGALLALVEPGLGANEAGPGADTPGKQTSMGGATKQGAAPNEQGKPNSAGGSAKQGTPAADDAAKGKTADTARETKAYPVTVVSPTAREFKHLVHGFGTVLADARSGRVVTSATAVELRSIEVLPGERVRAGQTLFTVAPDPAAYLTYQQGLSALTLAKGEVDRLHAQFADHLANATQVETAEKALADAEAQVAAARRQGAGAELATLRAPSDGIVTAITAAVGDRPAAGTVLATIAPRVALRATLGIEPGEQRLVHVSDRVTVKPVQAGIAPRTGRVSMVGAAVNPETRLVPVTVNLDAAPVDNYAAGLFVEGSIEAATTKAFSLPRTALVRDEQGTAVFEVVDGKAHRVPVVVEADEGARVGVSAPLDPSRPVVTVGAYELEDGVAVAERKP
jgi:RND family efflux transporter MFP subunit